MSFELESILCLCFSTAGVRLLKTRVKTLKLRLNFCFYRQTQQTQHGGDDKPHENETAKDLDLGVDYNRYLQEVVQVLESDPGWATNTILYCMLIIFFFLENFDLSKGQINDSSCGWICIVLFCSFEHIPPFGLEGLCESTRPLRALNLASYFATGNTEKLRRCVARGTELL